MIIDRSELEEYPYEGDFYTYEVDDSKPLDEQVEEEILVLHTKCDIQESQKSDSSGNIIATFDVYFPFNESEGVKITRGMTFRGNVYGLEVNGKVVGLYPTQMGACSCYVKDRDV